MMKLIALVAAAVFATGAMTAFAGNNGECTRDVANNEKMTCDVSVANLNLTPEQKTKWDAALAEHHKTGCNPASEAKLEIEAQKILTKDQFAKFKAEEKGTKSTQS